MTSPASRLLVLCYGNPGRLDDGLGPAFGEALEGEDLPGVTIDIDYQLTVEDAAAVAEHDLVLFVDAAIRGPEPFFMQAVRPMASLGFTSHGAEPEQIMALAADLTGSVPQGFAFGIRGYEFDEFGETLSPGAAANLAAALQYMVPVILRRDLHGAQCQLGEATVQVREE